MKIGYVVVGEDLSTELLRRQVIELLKEIKRQDSSLRISLINFQSIPSILNHIKDLKNLTNELNNHEIGHYIIPNLCPWPLPNLRFTKLAVGWRPYSVWNRFAARTFSIYALPLFWVTNRIFGIKTFHCRSYPATLAAITYKKLSKKINIIFDPRSDFPEEGITAGFWHEDSPDFLFWKKQEKKLLRESKSTALIGSTYLEHYKKSIREFSYFIAPNNVAIDNFKRNLISREKIRYKLGFSQNTVVFVYLGALTEGGWHRISFYKKFYDYLVSENPNAALLILTPKIYANKVNSEFSDALNVQVVSPLYHEVGDYLSAGDVGLMFLHRRKIAVGTKIGEYLCCNMPVLVNANCCGAVDLIQKNSSFGSIIGLGLGDKDTTIQINKIEIMQLSKYHPANEASTYFDLKTIAKTYREQYDLIEEK